jgi:hypothetical protein
MCMVDAVESVLFLVSVDVHTHGNSVATYSDLELVVDKVKVGLSIPSDPDSTKLQYVFWLSCTSDVIGAVGPDSQRDPFFCQFSSDKLIIGLSTSLALHLDVCKPEQDSAIDLPVPNNQLLRRDKKASCNRLCTWFKNVW